LQVHLPVTPHSARRCSRKLRNRRCLFASLVPQNKSRFVRNTVQLHSVEIALATSPLIVPSSPPSSPNFLCGQKRIFVVKLVSIVSSWSSVCLEFFRLKGAYYSAVGKKWAKSSQAKTPWKKWRNVQSSFHKSGSFNSVVEASGLAIFPNNGDVAGVPIAHSAVGHAFRSICENFAQYKW
jgi:hypothetical protein